MIFTKDDFMDNKKPSFKTTGQFNDYLFEHSLWKRYEGRELTEEQADFITACMSENLEHARHVENERLTFNSIFLALVAGAMALSGSLNAVMTFAMYLFLTIAGFLSIVLTARWNNAFQGIFIMRSGAIYCSISVFSAMWAISRIPLRIRPG